MSCVVCVLIALLACGLYRASQGETRFSAFGYPSWEPNLDGCLLSLATSAILISIGMMKLGAWLW